MVGSLVQIKKLDFFDSLGRGAGSAARRPITAALVVHGVLLLQVGQPLLRRRQGLFACLKGALRAHQVAVDDRDDLAHPVLKLQVDQQVLGVVADDVALREHGLGVFAHHAHMVEHVLNHAAREIDRRLVFFGGVLGRCDGGLHHRLDLQHALGDSLAAVGRSLRKAADFLGDDREAAPAVAGMRGLDGRVDGQDVGVGRNRADIVGHVAQLTGGQRQIADAVHQRGLAFEDA